MNPAQGREGRWGGHLGRGSARQETVHRRVECVTYVSFHFPLRVQVVFFFFSASHIVPILLSPSLPQRTVDPTETQGNFLIERGPGDTWYLLVALLHLRTTLVSMHDR